MSFSRTNYVLHNCKSQEKVFTFHCITNLWKSNNQSQIQYWLLNKSCLCLRWPNHVLTVWLPIFYWGFKNKRSKRVDLHILLMDLTHCLEMLSPDNGNSSILMRVKIYLFRGSFTSSKYFKNSTICVQL
jgi:hypothetical protein